MYDPLTIRLTGPIPFNFPFTDVVTFNTCPRVFSFHFEMAFSAETKRKNDITVKFVMCTYTQINGNGRETNRKSYQCEKLVENVSKLKPYTRNCQIIPPADTVDLCATNCDYLQCVPDSQSVVKCIAFDEHTLLRARAHAHTPILMFCKKTQNRKSPG